MPYNLWVAGDINFPLTDITFRQPGRGATFHSTFTVSPTLFNQLILGISQNKLTFFASDPERISRKGTGIDIPQFTPDLNPLGMIPNMTFGGVSNYANPSMHNGLPYYNANTIFSIVENLSWVRGTHVFKFGGYIERTYKDQSANAVTRGRMAFDRTAANPLDTNHPYANALLGIYRDYSEANSRPQGQYRFTNLEFYAQDAWRIRPRLLIDYGVRFYHNMPQYDALEQLATFVPEYWDPAQAPTLLMPAMNGTKKVAQDPVTGLYYPEGLIGTFAPGRGNPSNGMVIGGKDGWPRGLYTVPPISVAPRVGFAWDPFGRGRTAVRGGGGVFYDRIMGNPTMGLITNPPTILTPTVYYGTIDGLKDVSTGGILAPSTITSLIGDVDMPTVYNYSFGDPATDRHGHDPRRVVRRVDVTALPLAPKHQCGSSARPARRRQPTVQGPHAQCRAACEFPAALPRLRGHPHVRVRLHQQLQLASEQLHETDAAWVLVRRLHVLEGARQQLHRHRQRERVLRAARAQLRSAQLRSHSRRFAAIQLPAAQSRPGDATEEARMGHRQLGARRHHAHHVGRAVPARAISW